MISWIKGLGEMYKPIKWAFVAGWNAQYHFGPHMDGQAAWELYVEDCALSEICGDEELYGEQEPVFVSNDPS